MNRVILVTAIGGDVGHSVLKCLYNKNESLIGCDMKPYPVGMDLVEELFISLPASDINYSSHLLEQCKKYGVTHLIPISEPEIKVISNYRELFEDINIKVCINNKEIIQCCLDKYYTAKKLRGIGLDVPDFYKAEDFVPNGKKHIVKLRSSWGSKLLKVITTREELDEIYSATSESLIIQEFIDEPENEYTVGVFCDGNEVRVITFKRKLQGGFTKFVELSNDETIKRDAIIAAQEFRLVGSFNIQLRKSNGKNYIFEINPRLSGTVHFRHLLEFEEVLWWLDILDHEELNQYINNYTTAIGIREMNEKYLLIR